MALSRLLLAAAACMATLAVASASDTGCNFAWKNLETHGAWQPTDAHLSTQDGSCAGGDRANLVLNGKVFEPKGNITSGHVNMEIWELDVGNFVFKQNYDYFVCHGYPEVGLPAMRCQHTLIPLPLWCPLLVSQVCDPCKPNVLTYDNCTSPLHYSLDIDFVMPPPTASVSYSSPCLERQP